MVRPDLGIRGSLDDVREGILRILCSHTLFFLLNRLSLFSIFPADATSVAQGKIFSKFSRWDGDEWFFYVDR